LIEYSQYSRKKETIEEDPLRLFRVVDDQLKYGESRVYKPSLKVIVGTVIKAYRLFNVDFLKTCMRDEIPFNSSRLYY